MKTFRSLKWLAPLAALVLAPAVHAINITAAPAPDPFPAVPAVTDWSTASVGGASVAQTAAELDTKVIAATDAATILTVLPASPTFAPSANALVRWNDGTGNAANPFLQLRPTGVEYQLLLAHLTNATGGPLNSIQVAYDYSTLTNTIVENVEGVRAYWSISGAPGSWTLIPELSIDTAGTPAAPQAVSATITLPSPLADAGTMFVLWADQNSADPANPDASYHIDNFSASTGGPPACFITGSVSNVQRSPGVSATDPTDDTVSFDITVNGTGPLSASGWTTTAPPGVAGNSGAYGVAQTLSSIPISNFTGGNLQLTVQDAEGQAACQAILSVKTATVIGSNNVTGTPILTDGAAVNFWVFDETQRTSTQTSATQADHAVTSQVIDLSTTGEVLLRADMDAIAGTSSGFELADGFGIEVIIDGGAPISMLGLSDATPANGRLNGAAAVGGPELPDATVTGYTQAFSFYQLIPAGANSVQVRFIGNSNSPNETFVLKNLRLTASAPLVFVSTDGLSTLNHNNTVDAADDTFSGPVNVEAVGFAGVNWESDEVPPRTGAYATNPTVFGPYLVTGGPKTVIIHDVATPAIVSDPYTIPVPPAPVLAATAPATITSNPDGSVSFQSTVTSANAGPSFTVTGATASSNAYGAPVTFTIATPLPASPVMVTITDASYPGATQTLSVTLPTVYTIGQINLGAGLQDLTSSISDPLWVNDAGLRTLTMSAGVAADSIVASQVIDLSAVGDVTFSGKFNIADTSAGTNLEIGDRFKAELIINGDLNNPVSLLPAGVDVGDGAPSTGPNGPPNGYINGYTGTPDEADYNANLARDEFNTDGEIADMSINNDFLLSAVIPASANSVQLRIYGAGFSGSEIATVSEVLLTTGPVSDDTDGDGVSDADETIMGTSPTDPTDVLRLNQSSANPNIVSFPTKSGRFYKVYSSPDLVTWTPTALATFVGADNTQQFDITALITPGRKFFRLHVMEQDGPWN